MNTPEQTRRQILAPIERISEVLFGLIMVLTITSTLSIAKSGRAEVRIMLIGALGCNLAWGLIDAIMYLMACLTGRAEERRTVLAVSRAASPEDAYRAIEAALPPVVAAIMRRDDLERIRVAVSKLPITSERPGFLREDWLGATGVFLLVFVTTLPVVLPFVLFSDPQTALRASNAVALLMLFLTGYSFGRHAGHHPLLMAFGMVVLGMVLVAITIALGG